MPEVAALLCRFSLTTEVTVCPLMMIIAITITYNCGSPVSEKDHSHWLSQMLYFPYVNTQCVQSPLIEHRPRVYLTLNAFSLCIGTIHPSLFLLWHRVTMYCLCLHS